MNRERFLTDVLPLKNKLLRLATRITLCQEDAKDIVQETMLRVWDAREKWTQVENMEAYCLTICQRLALDFIKRKSNHNIRLTTELQDGTVALPSPEGYEEKEELGLIRQAMDTLPQAQRIIMELRDLEGKTYAEIAQLTQMNESQVKVYLHRARKKIKTIIEQIETYGL